jgi:MoaA/NifB/PqqE/SkfB family radical SAM enzyme
MNNNKLIEELRSKFPFRSLNVELTNICNLRCPLCFTGAGYNTSPRGTMDFNNFKRFMDTCHPLFDSVSFIGTGEPTIHPDFIRFVKYSAVEKQLTTYCCSNGHFKIEPEIIVNSGLRTIFIDMDGLTQSQQAIYRVGADLDKVVSNVRRLVETKRKLYSYFPMIYVDTLVTKHNERDLDEITEFARKLGVDGIRIRGIIDPLFGGSDWEATKPEYRHVKRDTVEECPFRNQIAGILAWNGDLHLCCLTSGHTEPVVKLNAFGEDDILNKLNSDKFYNLTRVAGHLPFCKDCSFISYELFERSTDFGLTMRRSVGYWVGKYGKHPLAMGRSLLRKMRAW